MIISRRTMLRAIPVAAGKKNKKRDTGGVQVYNLTEDIGETNNIAAAHPDLVKGMTGLLQRIRERGRSRP